MDEPEGRTKGGAENRGRIDLDCAELYCNYRAYLADGHLRHQTPRRLNALVRQAIHDLR